MHIDAAPHYGLRPGSRYILLNARVLLDAAEEYFIDAQSGMLFFIAPAGIDPATEPVVLSQQQHAHTMNGTTNVRVEGMRFEYSQGSAVQALNVTRVTVANCTVANAGTQGVNITGASSTLSFSTIHSAGCEGVSFNGGDTVSLTRGNISIQNNTITRFARVSRTIRPGIGWSGCGNTVVGNEISDAPHSGIMISPASDGRGVDTLFEGNHLHDLCKGTADAGGFYAGASWANRGNRIINNRFERFYQTEKMAQSTSINGVCKRRTQRAHDLLCLEQHSL